MSSKKVELAARREELRESVDTRAQRTRALVFDAATKLSSLGETITVSKLARTAAISRGTFYTHFRDLEDVALSIYEKTLSDITAQEELHNYVSASDVRAMREKSMRQLVQHFNENQSLYLAVLTVTDSKAIEERIAARIKESIIFLHYKKVSPPPAIQIEPIAHMLSAGYARLLCDWVTGAISLSPSSMALHLLELMPTWMKESHQGS